MIETLAVAYLTGSCFTALGIYLGLRCIASSILRAPRFKLPKQIIIEKAKDGSEFKIRPAYDDCQQDAALPAYKRP